MVLTLSTSAGHLETDLARRGRDDAGAIEPLSRYAARPIVVVGDSIDNEEHVVASAKHTERCEAHWTLNRKQFYGGMYGSGVPGGMGGCSFRLCLNAWTML